MWDSSAADRTEPDTWPTPVVKPKQRVSIHLYTFNSSWILVEIKKKKKFRQNPLNSMPTNLQCEKPDACRSNYKPNWRFSTEVSDADHRSSRHNSNILSQQFNPQILTQTLHFSVWSSSNVTMYFYEAKLQLAFNKGLHDTQLKGDLVFKRIFSLASSSQISPHAENLKENTDRTTSKNTQHKDARWRPNSRLQWCGSVSDLQ